MAVLRVRGSRLGAVREIRELLTSCETVYEHLYAFELIVEKTKTRANELEVGMWRRSVGLSPSRRITAQPVRNPASVVLPEDQLVLRSASFQSPGFWDFAGTLNPLEVIRRYLADRHERNKDMSYRQQLEAERLALENQKLKTEVVKDQIELLRGVGVPEDKIRQIIVAHISTPLALLDAQQDSGLISDASLVATGDVSPTRPDERQ
jgi:hypothetical protein